MVQDARQHALKHGYSKYFTGKPCKHGHVCERYTVNRVCVRCNVAKNTKYQYPDKRTEGRKEYYRNYRRNRRNQDITFKLAGNLRTRLWHAIKNNWKVGSAISDLGCSIDYLKSYLEGLFIEPMNWENYGVLWEIDHVHPLSKFNLEDRGHFQEACHYTNLQPMLISDNRKKSNRINTNEKLSSERRLFE